MGRVDERRRIVEQFNDRITRADLAGLGALIVRRTWDLHAVEPFTGG